MRMAPTEVMPHPHVPQRDGSAVVSGMEAMGR